MSDTISSKVLKAIEKSPNGIIALDMLESLRVADRSTLKTTLSRLNKAGKIIRLKRGLYSHNPIQDVFATAQATFKGYLGFTSALYLHKLIAEMPFTIVVVTTHTSKSKTLGIYESKAVALKEKAIGFERKENYVISTRAKTLFDCIYLQEYSIEPNKLVESFKQAKLSSGEWHEFDLYVKKFAKEKSGKRFYDMKKRIMGGRTYGT